MTQTTYELATQAVDCVRSQQYARGLDFVNQALASINTDSSDATLIPELLNIRAECFRFLGNLPDAIKSYDEAWSLARLCDDDGLKSTILSNRGIAYQSASRLDEAIASHEMALEKDILIDDQEGQGYSRHNLGGALLADGKYDKALEEVTRAEEIRVELCDWVGLVSTLSLKAAILVELDRIDEAKVSVEKALSLKDKGVNSLIMRHALVVLADICEMQGKSEQALPPLLQSIELIENIRTGIQSRDQLAKFDDRYDGYFSRIIKILLESERDEDALELIDRVRSRSLHDEMLSIDCDLNPPELGIALRKKVASALNSDEVLIEFWLWEGTVFSFLVDSKGGISRHKIKLSTVDFSSGVDELFSSGVLTSNSSREINDSIAAMINPRLEEFRRIYFILHGEQFQIPIAAIRLESGQYLSQHLESVVHPSIPFFLHSKKSTRYESTSALVVGDPDGTLPYARKEAINVAKMLQCSAIVGSEATLDRVLQLLSENHFDIIHFACHHVLDEQNSQCGLIMADGQILTSQHLRYLSVRTNLICTASCNSGFMHYSPTNSLFGLNRALFLAGANSVISSINQLDDAATSQFFKEFYQQFQVQKSASGALAKTQQNMIHSDQFSEPSYWAGLYLMGAD